MFEANNVIQPCILCAEPVTTAGSLFCNNCSIFKDGPKLEAAVLENNPQPVLVEDEVIAELMEDVVIELEEDEDYDVSYDVEER